jgi:hypothetical protein
MEITKHQWPAGTRSSSFCLGLQGGSVFADFDIDPTGCVYLVRISFDGYGCCVPDGDIPRLTAQESRTLLGLLDLEEVNVDKIGEILRCFFDRSRGLIWADALAEHGLLRD